jgi:hypothetical protein
VTVLGIAGLIMVSTINIPTVGHDQAPVGHINDESSA